MTSSNKPSQTVTEPTSSHVHNWVEVKTKVEVPEGGTELYNYVEKLIVQTGGNPDAVPTLSGAKGIIPENIPGLYVTIEETRGGFSLMFWAE